MYKCIKGFSIEKCDDDGFTVDGESVTVEEDSVWHLPIDKDYKFLGGEVRLEHEDGTWVEISEEHLKDYFEVVKEKPICFISNKEINPLCKGMRNRFDGVFTTCQSCKSCELMKKS